MNTSFVKKVPFIIYLVKFLGFFCVLYYGSIALIGLTAPGGYYVPFLDHYCNYVSWLRSSLLFGAKAIVSAGGFEAFTKNIYSLQVEGGLGVHVGFSCLGYGVMNFWAAFIIANPGSLRKKTAWLLGGLLIIWLINITRISLLLIAINKNWPSLLGLDHHALFNISVYTCIFTGIYFYAKSNKAALKIHDAQS